MVQELAWVFQGFELFKPHLQQYEKNLQRYSHCVYSTLVSSEELKELDTFIFYVSILLQKKIYK